MGAAEILPAEALRVTARLLKPGGKIYITQTYQRRASWGISVWKPLLKYVTTIDFGSLVMEEEVEKFISDAGMRIERNEIIPNSVDNMWQAARLIVIDPAAAVAVADATRPKGDKKRN